MFYYVKGTLVMLSPNAAAIDCSGVAYRLSISGTTYNELARVGEGKEAKLYTYLSVKEDGMELYGFADESELDVFTMLITVSGVGPKAATSILSAVTPDRFVTAVSAGDYATLSKANGVGAKTAQRIILELQSKVEKQLGAGTVFSTGAAVTSKQGTSQIISEAINALCVLGYTRQVASDAVSKAAKDGLSLEDTITLALKQLSRR